MDGQLGFDGENVSEPRLLDKFIELGSPPALSDETEVKSKTPLKISEVNAGGMMSVAIDNLGALWIWGNCPQQSSSSNETFALSSISTPVPVWGFLGHTVVKVACGNEHVMAIVSAGETYQGDDLVCYAWGNNKHGQLGLGDTESRSRPQLVESFSLSSPWAVYEVKCGAFHTAILTHKKSQTLESICWTFGLGENGQLGHGTTQSASSPKPIQSLPQNVYLVSIDCGLFHTSAVSSAGHVWSWGMEKGLGLCPDASFTGTDSGDAISPLLISCNEYEAKFPEPVQVACGAAHTILVAEKGYKLWSWGRGRSGVLGDGRTIDSFAPTMVLWPPLSEDFKEAVLSSAAEVKKTENKDPEAAMELEKSLSSAMEEINILQSKLSKMEWYASILHGLIFNRPLQEQDVQGSLGEMGNFDLRKEWERTLELADEDKLARLEMFHRNMLAGVKDKLMKRRIQEIIKEFLHPITREH
ncbi:hypothetical protein Nepgr_013697 [Nepenthes gracilis]|uniref:Ultraviolet-B receptor UVR8 n=1 Tax=Nepenthes gracilis TaxID=150966 RepID=A0AAD3SJM5_NEPGR|nr:hypothetical protein Nepgr_013697 [Nepenthes gracilis]